jgi:hypothetical protein
MPPIVENDVKTTQAFRKTALIDLPVPTFKSSPKVRPNPFTGLPQTDAYAREHHLVEEAPETVLDATKSNNPF